MREINQLKSLPKVEISFQDDFSGSPREYTLTPKYILSEVRKFGLIPKIGDEILLWEKDMEEGVNEHYLCNVGKILEGDIQVEDTARIDNKTVVVKIDEKEYFNLPIDSFVFVHEFVNTIKSREDFARFLEMFLNDYLDNKDKAEWENKQMDRFLEAMGAYAHDLGGYYKNIHPELDADVPTWRVFADILLGAKVYE